ncbi:MAG TPA: hypothetical protein VGI84_00330 [Pseudonocardiaceae bacterium]
MISRARDASEACWQGRAADAFRASLDPLRGSADHLVDVADRTWRALEVFADEVDTVRSRMHQARDVAAAARLVVTATTILPPGPGPGAPPPSGPPTPEGEAGYHQRVVAYEAAAAAYAAQVAAFNEASVTVGEARGRESEAHRRLDAAMIRGSEDVGTFSSLGLAAVQTALSAVGDTENAVKDLLTEADRIQAHGDRMQALAMEPTAPQSTSTAASRAAEAAKDGELRTRAEADRISRPFRRIPEEIRRNIARNPGDYLPTDAPWSKLGRTVGRGVPFVGTAITVGAAGVEVAHGKPVGDAAAETAAGLAGGIAGAEVGGAIGTALFPGVGTVIGGVVGGVIGGVVATEGADRALGDDDS